MARAMMLAALLLASAPCWATDGDTIRCGAERIRLSGIDAPETPGHCRRGRTCAPGDPAAATAHLRRLLAAGPLTIRRFGRDRYGRTLALVSVRTPAGPRDLSCAQLTARHAIYRPDWDNRRSLAATCPQALRFSAARSTITR